MPLSATPSASPAWTPEPSDVSALGAAGQRFLRAMLEESDCSLVQGTLLLEASSVLDRLTAWRATAHTDPKAARLALQHAKTFADLLSSLRTW
jgi:hypothetical protein